MRGGDVCINEFLKIDVVFSFLALGFQKELIIFARQQGNHVDIVIIC